MARNAKPPRRANYIYGLADPRDGFLFYVGKTSNPATRVQRHLSERSNKQRVQKIHDIVGQGRQPVLVILEAVPAGTNWGDRERYWIAFGRELGWPLTNVSEGGEGSEPKQYVNDRRNGRRPPGQATRPARAPGRSPGRK